MLFYFYTGGHIALCSLFLFHYSNYKLSTNSSLITYLSLFFATWLAYTWVQLPILENQIIKWRNARHNYFLKNQSEIIHFSLGLIIVNIILFIKLENIVKIISLPLIILVGLYQLPIRKFSLRNIPYLKSFFISFIWACLMTILPYSEKHDFKKFGQLQFLHFLEIFCLIHSLTIIFDLRDVKLDNFRGLRTLATIRTERFIKPYALLLVFLPLLFNLNAYSSLFYNYALFFIFFMPLLFLANEKKSDLFFLAGVDSLIIIKSLPAFYN